MNRQHIHLMVSVIIIILAVGYPACAAHTADEWYNAGNNSFIQGQYDDALSFFELSLKLRSDDPLTLSQKAMTLERLGRYDEAINTVNMAIESAKKEASKSVSMDQLKEELKNIEEMRDTAINLSNTTNMGWLS